MPNLYFRACWLSLITAMCLGAAIPAQQPLEHAPDADVTLNGVQSIAILPLPNAPFTATVVTEAVNIQPNGSKRILYNRRTVARDSSGRVFQERRYITPTGDTELPPLSLLQYQDPNRHRMYHCDPATHICNEYEFNVQPPVKLAASPAADSGLRVSPDISSDGFTREDLGTQTQDTLQLVGTRETTLIKAGVIGSEQPEAIVKEFWYSPYLGINIITKRSDPRVSALQNFHVENIVLGEPDPKLFRLPSDYRLVSANEGNSSMMTIYNEYITCPVRGACNAVLRPVIIRRRR